MPKLTLKNMILQYAKVFDKQGQVGDIDRGDEKSSKKWLRELAKQPISVVDCYFPDDETMNILLEHDNFNNEVRNPQTGETSTRIKKGVEGVGNGHYIKLKRKTGEVLEYFDKKKGKEVSVELESFVRVSKIERDEAGTIIHKEEYDYDQEGPIGNGTVADIFFDVYGEGATRLEAIGITKLEKFDTTSSYETEF